MLPERVRTIAENGGSGNNKTLSWLYGFEFGNPNAIAGLI